MSGTILVDVDGTLADQMEHCLDVAARNGIAHDASPADITSWNASVPGSDIDIGELIQLVEREYTREYVSAMPVMDGARDAIARLRDAGWRVVICTHRNPESHPYTANWLAAHDIPFDAYAHDVPTTKADLDADVLIDDYHGHIRDALDAGLTGVLFEQPYSEPAAVTDHSSGVVASDWDDVINGLVV